MSLLGEQENLVDSGSRRTRKIALCHHSNYVLFDANGNAREITRLGSVSEIMPDKTGCVNATIENNGDDVQNQAKTFITNNEVKQLNGANKDELGYQSGSPTAQTDRDSGMWETTVMQQIQNLIQNVQVSENLAEFINKELKLGDKLNGTLNKVHSEQRSRRKSCFAGYNEKHSQPTRRQSVTALCQNKSRSLPRTNLNTGEVGLIHHGRRTSVTQIAGRRDSVTHPGILVTCPSSRRNSLAHLYRRRSSLAHAFQHSAMHNGRRMSTTHDQHLDVPPPNIPQRRRSSVKPPCFPITKISSVQKRLNRIYNRRCRRNDRAEVKMSDVKKAFRNIRKGEGVYISESEQSEKGSAQSANVSDTEEVDENRNPCRKVHNESAEFSEPDTCIESVDGVADTVILDAESVCAELDSEPKPEPRRKTSIQVRSWELSRRLRQRRREKRKGFRESELI